MGSTQGELDRRRWSKATMGEIVRRRRNLTWAWRGVRGGRNAGMDILWRLKRRKRLTKFMLSAWSRRVVGRGRGGVCGQFVWTIGEGPCLSRAGHAGITRKRRSGGLTRRSLATPRLAAAVTATTQLRRCSAVRRAGIVAMSNRGQAGAPALRAVEAQAGRSGRSGKAGSSVPGRLVLLSWSLCACVKGTASDAAGSRPDGVANFVVCESR